MSILVVLGIAVPALCMLWAVQSVVLKLVGEPLAWPLRFTTRKPLVRWTARVMVQASWLVILVGTPLALGIRPLDALQQAFPTPVPWRAIPVPFSVMFFSAWALFALYIKAGLGPIRIIQGRAAEEWIGVSGTPADPIGRTI